MIVDDKQIIPIYFERSKFLIFQNFPKNLSTEVINMRTQKLNWTFFKSRYVALSIHVNMLMVSFAWMNGLPTLQVF